METATTAPVRGRQFRLAALPRPLPEVLHWRLDQLLAETELEGLVPPEMLCQEVHRGTVALSDAR